MTVERFTLEARPGDLIRGEIRRPPGHETSSRLGSAVVVVHGFKGFKDWGFFPYLADRLAADGHTVVSFNFSRNGVGEDFEHFSELDSFGSNTLSLELGELRNVLDRVFSGSLLGALPERVGILGHSRGGGQAVLATSEEPRLGALVTWAAVADFDRWPAETKEQWRREGRIWIANARTRQQMPLDLSLLDDFEANRERLDILAAARRVHVPWLVVHGTADETVDPREAEALVAAGSEAHACRVEGTGHTFGASHPFAGAPAPLEEAVRASLEHLDRALRPA